MKDYITVIGGGLAGCEAAYQIAKKGIKVKLNPLFAIQDILKNKQICNIIINRITNRR